MKEIIKRLSALSERNRKLLLFIFGFGVNFTVALMVQLVIGSHGFISYIDSQYYYQTIANNLLNHHVFSIATSFPFFPDGTRTPLYPFLVALFALLKMPLLVAIIFQNLIAGMRAVIVYRIGKILFTKKVGFIAAVISIVEPMSIYWNNLLMSDYLFAFLLLAAFYYFLRKSLVLFPVFLGLAALTRPVALYLLPLFIITYFIVYKEPLAVKVKNSVIVFLFCLLTVSPWLVRNRLVFNHASLSSVGWFVLYDQTLGEFAKERGFELPRPTPTDPAMPGNIFKYSFANAPFYRHNFLTIVSQNLPSYAVFHVGVSMKSFLSHNYDYFLDYVVRAKFYLPDSIFLRNVSAAIIAFLDLLWTILYAGLLISCFVVKKNKEYKFLMIGIMMFSVLLNGHPGSNVGSRFNLSLMPFIFLLGVDGLAFLVNKYSLRNSKI